MDRQRTDKKFVKWYTIISFALVAVFIVIMLILMWLGYGQFTDPQGNPAELTLEKKITFTVVFVILIVLATFLAQWMFKHQAKRDTQQLKTIQTKK